MQLERRSEFTSYHASPLGAILAGVLKKIAEIKKRLARDQGDSLKRKHADDLMNFLEWMLSVLHDNILPRFDNGEKNPSFPNFLVQGAYAVKILLNRDLFNTRESLLFRHIAKQLPNLVKEARSQTSGRLVFEIVNSLLEEKKNELFKKAEKIPGRNLDDFFSQVKKAMASLNLTVEAPFTDKGFSNYIDDQIEILGNALFGIGAPYEDGGFAFEHYHPVIFELAVEIAQLFQAAPRALDELIPFLNPNAVVAFFANALDTFVPTLLKTLAPQAGVADLKLEFKGSPDPQHTTYLYGLTLRKTQKKPRPIDGAAHYAGFFGFSFSGLLGQIVIHHRKFHKESEVDGRVRALVAATKKHCDANVNEKWVASENARASLLQEFVDQELKYIEGTLSVIPVPDEHFVALKGLELIAALGREIVKEDERERLISALVKRRKHYFLRVISAFIKISNTLQEKLLQHHTAGYDTAYIRVGLPDDILGYVEGQFQIIPIKSRLTNLIRERVRELNYDSNTKEILVQKRQDAIGAWVNAEIQGCGTWLQKSQEEVDEQKGVLKALMAAAKNRVVDSCDIHSLEQAIEAVLQEKTKVQNMGDFAKCAISTTIKKAQLSEKAPICDEANTVIQVLSETAKKIVHTINEFSALTVPALESLDSEEKDLHALLEIAQEQAREKALAKEKYDEDMRSLNIEKMEEQLRDHCVQLESLIARKHGMIDDLKAPRARLEVEAVTQASLIREVHERLPAGEYKPTLDSFLSDHTALNSSIETGINMITAKVLADEKKLKQPIGSEAQIVLFGRVKEALFLAKENSNKMIPFAEIVSIDGLKVQEPLEGFKLLIRMLSAANKQFDWEKYISEEGAPLRIFQPGLKRRAEAFAALESAIATQEQKESSHVNKYYEDQVVLKALESSKNRLGGIQLELKAIDESRQAFGQQQQVLDQLELEENKLEDHVKALKSSIHILKFIAVLSEDSKNFFNGTKFSVDPTLYSQLNHINKKISELEELMKDFALAIEKEELAATYRPMFEKIELIIKEMTNNITHSVKEKFSDVVDAIKKLQKDIQAFKDGPSSFSSEQSLYVDASALKVEMVRLQGVLRQLREVIKEDDRPGNYVLDLKAAEDAFVSTMALVEPLIATKFNASLEGVAAHIRQNQKTFDHLMAVLYFGAQTKENNLCTNRSIQAINALLESCDILSKSVLKDHNEAVTILQNTPVLRDELKSEQIFNVTQAFCELKDKIATLQKRAIRVKMLSDMSAKLNHYLLGRAVRYPHPDPARERFVKELLQLMVSDSNGQDSNAILEKIKSGRHLFPSVHFGTVLNQIKVGILDFNRTGILHEQEPLPVAHQDALLHLERLKQSHPQYVRGIKTLYDNIDRMSSYVPDLSGDDQIVIIQLAARLRADVDRFVRSDPQNSRNSHQAYLAFKETFTARLHSQDVILRKYRPLWTIVASIAVAVISLGTQLLYSKLHYGRITLFFDNAAHLSKEVASMEKTISESRKFGAVR